MSIFYDPHKRRPRLWAVLFPIVLVATLWAVLALYSDAKLKDKAASPGNDVMFEEKD